MVVTGVPRVAGSAVVASHRHGDDRVQDAYSLRCSPQVHGAGRDVADQVIQEAIDRATEEGVSTSRWPKPHHD